MENIKNNKSCELTAFFAEVPANDAQTQHTGSEVAGDEVRAEVGEPREDEPKSGLRVMGAFSAAMIVVASMVGTGVFTTGGLLLEQTPSPVAVLVGWLIGGAGALFGALSYGELVSKYPKNGGEFHLLGQIYHPALGFIAGWVSLVVGFGAPIAAAAIAFGVYLHAVFPSVNTKAAAIVLIVFLSVIHGIKVTWGAKMQNFFTVTKLCIILVFIAGGLSVGNFSYLTTQSPSFVAGQIFSPAFAVGLIFITYAYSGWNGAAYLAGEIKNPRRSLPIALAVGSLSVTLVYVGLNLVFFMAAPHTELAGQINIGTVAATNLFGKGPGGALSGIISLLLVSSVSALIMAGPRVYQSIGDRYPVFSFLSFRLKGSGPIYAIALQATVSIAMLLSASFDTLLTYMGFTLSISAGLTVFGVFVLRGREKRSKEQKDKKRDTYRCFGYPVTPALFIALALWMVVFTLLEQPIVALSGLGTILAGLLLYLGVLVVSNPGRFKKL